VSELNRYMLGTLCFFQQIRREGVTQAIVLPSQSTSGEQMTLKCLHSVDEILLLHHGAFTLREVLHDPGGKDGLNGYQLAALHLRDFRGKVDLTPLKLHHFPSELAKFRLPQPRKAAEE
jgi:hypothetical protein